jgi:hypothetical protein
MSRKRYPKNRWFPHEETRFHPATEDEGDLAILRTGNFPFPDESLKAQRSQLIHAKISIDRIDTDYRHESSEIGFDQVANIHEWRLTRPSIGDVTCVDSRFS